MSGIFSTLGLGVLLRIFCDVQHMSPYLANFLVFATEARIVCKHHREDLCTLPMVSCYKFLIPLCRRWGKETKLVPAKKKKTTKKKRKKKGDEEEDKDAKLPIFSSLFKVYVILFMT